MTKPVNGSSTEVKQSPLHLDVKGLNPAFAHPLCFKHKPAIYLIQALSMCII